MRDLKKYRKLTLLLVWLPIIALLAACGANNAAENEGEGKITVYTSFYTMYDFTVKIGGGRVTVTNMIPSGTEPHDWEPSPKAVAGLSMADLFIYNGGGMESWAEKVIQSVNNPELHIVETSKGLIQESAETAGIIAGGDGKGHSDGASDPHIWLNPMLAKKQMEAIRDGLVQVDPSNREYYESNFNLYSARLDELDKAYREAVKSFSKKEIVVSHEAFGYLCEAYGLKQLAIEGIAGESEPTPAKMAEVIDYVKEHDVKVIFFEELASPKTAEAIAMETGVKTAMLNPLEGLGEESIKAGKDYFSVMEENLEALKEALR